MKTHLRIIMSNFTDGGGLAAAYVVGNEEGI
jgi:hypothetical protein